MHIKPWKILIDLDGVLSNFTRTACEIWDKPNPYADGKGRGVYDVPMLLGIEALKFWEPYGNADVWAGQHKTEEADMLVNLCKSAVGVENVCILSAPNLNEESLVGKIRWVKKHYPEFKRQYLFGPRKHFCAAENHILIDDYDLNVDNFIEAGGKAILFPRPWNRNHVLNIDPVEYVTQELHKLQIMVGF